MQLLGAPVERFRTLIDCYYLDQMLERLERKAASVCHEQVNFVLFGQILLKIVSTFSVLLNAS